MASTRFNMIGYAIIFMSLHILAYSLQDIEKMVMSSRNKIDAERAMLSRPEKVTMNVAPFSSEMVAKGGVIGGRKMAKTVNKQYMNDEETASKKASSSSSDNPSTDDHKPHKRSKKTSSTFMVINADYHVPRSHPPKNN